eukprot:scaffold2334_cov118-Cylindrotheca_fusiformis.AAC.24
MQQSSGLSRRNALRDMVTASAIAWSSQVQLAVAASSTDSLVEDLVESQGKLKQIPGLLKEEEWNKVRTILKTPPVNKLWNLGDSQNIILKLAKETGNVELFEVKDDIAYNLQMCDQLAYDNVFVYYQPGNGKIKIKEPQEVAERAIAQIQQVLDELK